MTSFPSINYTGKKLWYHCLVLLFVFMSAQGFSQTTAFHRVRAISNDPYTGRVNVKENEVVKKAAGVSRQQAITFKAFGQKQVGDADFDPKATSSSGLAVNYVSTDPSVATIVDGKIRITGTGMTLIIVSQEGDDSYDSAISVIRPLRVTASTK